MNVYTYNNIYKYMIDQIQNFSLETKKYSSIMKSIINYKNKVVSLKS